MPFPQQVRSGYTPVMVRAPFTGLVAFIREHLPVSDERRVHGEEITLAARKGGDLDQGQREVLVDAMAIARQAHLRENLRVRSFMYIVYGVSIALAVTVVLVAVFGSLWPNTATLCFQPEGIGVVCPTASDTSDQSRETRGDVDELYAKVASRWDYLVVEFIGLVAAAFAAVASTAANPGHLTSHNVPVAVALLKLPTGALTALLGLLLMRGECVPGLRALDSSAQVSPGRSFSATPSNSSPDSSTSRPRPY
ncbi:hypothetical protein GCM10010219_40980 [Streptomyces netropsis]|nr:hypothetical protein GCM10010219_40980 [Streptomyces netropsis]